MSLATRLGPAALLHRGDRMVWDRWRWLQTRLPNDARLILDAGCGNGSLAVNVALSGYEVHGLSYDSKSLEKASAWAEAFQANATFSIQDLRDLDERKDLYGRFDCVICTEVIEHLVDDAKLVRDLARVLRPGGTLCLTTPYYGMRPMYGDDMHPEPVEDGRHVRRGYTATDLRGILESAGFEVSTIEGTAGALSQFATNLQRRTRSATGSDLIAWIATLPVRFLNPSSPSAPLTGRRPAYSICAVAIKPAQ